MTARIDRLAETAKMVLAVERTEYKNPSGHPTMRADAAIVAALVECYRFLKSIDGHFVCPGDDACDDRAAGVIARVEEAPE